ncbi:MAG: SGNH/GDSL hydrolase family protein [Actinomycetota bacterium]|nr:SGNH/GDSL hydrolase family protein [Actinomycetota bacterium]
MGGGVYYPGEGGSGRSLLIDAITTESATRAAAITAEAAARSAADAVLTATKQATLPANAYAAYRAGLGKAGIFVPADWGTRSWFPALTASGTTTAVCACIGDSITRGYFGTTLGGWVDILRTALQATYGDGGSGWKGSADTTFASSAASQYPAQNIGVAGAGWFLNTVNDGPGTAHLLTSAFADTYTVSGLRGTSITFYLLQWSGAGTYTYAVDGGASVTDTGAGANGIKAVTISGLSNTTHTLVLTNAANGTYLCPMGAIARKATGVRVDNYGRPGGLGSQLVPASPLYGHPTDWTGGSSNPADLLIYGYGVNDAHAGVTAATYLANLNTWLDRVRSSRRGKVDILIALPHIGNWSVTAGDTALWRDYMLGVWDVARTYGAAVIDFWARGHNSYDEWTDLVYWSDDTAGGTGGSAVHPNNAGFAFMAADIGGVITP